MARTRTMATGEFIGRGRKNVLSLIADITFTATS